MSSQPHPLLIAIAGPAGSGKSTLCDRLVAEDPSFIRVVTDTTRLPRTNEVNGKDYNFRPTPEFKQREAAGEYLETALVHGKPGEEDRWYGTPFTAILTPLYHGQNLVIHVNTDGIAAFREYAHRDPLFACALYTIFVWAHVPVLIERMQQRYARDHGIIIDQITPAHNAEIARRIASFEREMQQMGQFDSQIQSGTKEEDFSALQTIVQRRKQDLARRHGMILSGR